MPDDHERDHLNQVELLFETMARATGPGWGGHAPLAVVSPYTPAQLNAARELKASNQIPDIELTLDPSMALDKLNPIEISNAFCRARRMLAATPTRAIISRQRETTNNHHSERVWVQPTNEELIDHAKLRINIAINTTVRLYGKTLQATGSSRTEIRNRFYAELEEALSRHLLGQWVLT